MKILINGEVYDAEFEQVYLKLTDQDKRNIANMKPECDVFAAVPKGADPWTVDKQMERLKKS